MSYKVKRFSSNGYHTHLERVALQNDKNRYKALNRANLMGNQMSDIVAYNVASAKPEITKTKEGLKDLEELTSLVSDDVHKYGYDKTLRREGLKRSFKTLGIANIKAMRDRYKNGKLKDTRGTFRVIPKSMFINKKGDLEFDTEYKLPE